MATKRSSTKRSANETKSDLTVSYDEFKEHEGQRYTGMKIGRSHNWYYDQGEWKESRTNTKHARQPQRRARVSAHGAATSATRVRRRQRSRLTMAG